MTANRHFRLAAQLLVAGTALASLSAHAASSVWPSTVAPCNGTLQACIDAAPSPSTVYIAANDVVNTGPAGQNVRLSRSVSLAAADGFHPVFPVGVGIVFAPSTSVEVGISGITLRDDGISLFPSAGGSFYIERMRLLDNVGGGGIDLDTSGTAPVYVRVHDNEYLRRGGAGNFCWHVPRQHRSVVRSASIGSAFDADSAPTAF